MKTFIQGLGTIPWAWRFLRSHPRALGLVIVPLFIGILVGIGAIAAAWAIAQPGSWGEFPEWKWEFDAIQNFLSVGFSLLVHLLEFILLVFLFYLGGFALLCSTFYSLMVEQLEKRLGLEPGEGISPPFLTQLSDNVRLLTFLILGQILILSLHLIPILGNLLAIILGFTFQAFCIGMECFDFTLSLRGMGFRQKLDYCKSNLGWTLGTGGISSLFMMVPILNTCFLTLSILGATLLHRRKLIYQRQREVLGPGVYQSLSDGDSTLVRYGENSPDLKTRLREGEVEKGELLYLAQSVEDKTYTLFTKKGAQLSILEETEEFLSSL